jgi:hypothetical protein
MRDPGLGMVSWWTKKEAPEEGEAQEGDAQMEVDGAETGA